jgi:hypothetical protein
MEKVVREVAHRGHGGGGGGQGGGDVDPTTEGEERRRKLQSVVVVVEPTPYTSAAAMARRTRSWQRGPSGGDDGRANGESVTWTQWRQPGGWGGSDVDSSVAAVAEWMGRQRRGHVQVKILRFRV